MHNIYIQYIEKENSHYCNVDEFLEGMSGDLLESHVTEPSVRFIDEINSHNNILKNNKCGYMYKFLYIILKDSGGGE